MKKIILLALLILVGLMLYNIYKPFFIKNPGRESLLAELESVSGVGESEKYYLHIVGDVELGNYHKCDNFREIDIAFVKENLPYARDNLDIIDSLLDLNYFRETCLYETSVARGECDTLEKNTSKNSCYTDVAYAISRRNICDSSIKNDGAINNICKSVHNKPNMRTNLVEILCKKIESNSGYTRCKDLVFNMEKEIKPGY